MHKHIKYGGRDTDGQRGPGKGQKGVWKVKRRRPTTGSPDQQGSGTK